jgi:hypothetical protein
MSEWFYAVDGVQYGPVDDGALRALLAEGRMRPEDRVWSDGMPEWVEARSVSAIAGEQVAPFFSIGLVKFAVMTLGTIGIYPVYWFYKHWKTIRARTGDDIWPIPRAIFAVFFFHELMATVETYATGKNRTVVLQKRGMAVLFFLLNISWRLPDPFWLIGFLYVLPLLYVQHHINQLHAAVAPYTDRNTRIRRWNWLAIVLGLPFMALAIYGSFLPN